MSSASSNNWNVSWLPEALDDVARLHAFLHDKSPKAAARLAANLLEGANQLQHMPDVGRPLGGGTGRCELVLPFGAGFYVLRYKVEPPNQVVILRVWYQREAR